MAERVRLKSWTMSTRCSSLLVCLLLLSLAYGAYGAVPYFTDFHFRQEPEPLVAKRGMPTLMNCSAVQAQSTPRIQWMRDGEYLQDIARRYVLDNGSLVFDKVVHEKGNSDKGGYQCLATVEGIGTIVSRMAMLDVAFLPKHFEASPADIAVHPNDTAMFECHSQGLPAPDVRWFRDSWSVTPGPEVIIYPSGVLEISRVTAGGRFRCEVTNIERTRASQVATLTLKLEDTGPGRAPNFVLTPRDQVAVIGEEVFLHCGANGRDRLGNTPRIDWLKDGATIDFKVNQRMKLLGSGTLHIRDVRSKDAGAYTCRATNAEDFINTDATLTVTVPPYFVKKPANVFAHPNSDIMLECKAEGQPSPTITWYKNGDLLRPSAYFRLVGGTNLKILGLVETDRGIYQCFADNALGNVQASAQLIILQQDTPLPTTRSPHSLALPAGALKSDLHKLPPSPVDLQAVLVSQRFVTVSWKRPPSSSSSSASSSKPRAGGESNITAYSVFWREEGSERERVSNTSRTEFNIQNLKPDTTYEVRVQAYNRFGASQREATITVTTDKGVDVPSAPVNLRATTLSSTAIRVDWEPPLDPKGEITHYSLIYYEVGSLAGEANITVTDTSHTLENLNVFREYSVRVVANNHNGRGRSTAEVVAKTYSAIPSATPQNFTLEVSSATRIIIRWQPPSPEAQNGIINGYRIRYKASNNRRGDTVVTDGNRNAYALTGLQKGVEYKVRIAAMTVNGTGPSTDWEKAKTYSDDLDESLPLPQPAMLYAKTRANSIVVQWAPPPPESKVLVRGYVLGYGLNIADVFQVRLDANARDYTIKNLQPASEYVISIKAFNNRGYGPSRYYSVITSEDIAEETTNPMPPPIGLKAIVLTSSTIVLTWADDSLGRSQTIVDYRYYTVRYSVHPRGRNKYLNATDLVAHIDGLRPNTNYEFAVKVINGRRQSQWSMAVTNTTFEAEPSSEPRDLTPVPLENDPLAVSIHWQPPQRPNGQITGYLIFYTTDAQQEDRDWVVEGVVGDKLSTVIAKLTADTTYYFKVQARNRKGYGPMSRVVKYSTPTVAKTESAVSEESGGLPHNMIIIIVACVAGLAFVVVIAIITVFLCKRRDNMHNRGTYKSPVKPIKASGKDVPPDLWIHQPSHMELQHIDKGRRSESSVSVATSTLPRGSHTSSDRLDDIPPGSDVDKRRNSIVGESGYPSSGEDGGRYQPIQPRNIIRPKPITLPVDTQTPPREPVATVTALPNGHILGYGVGGGMGQQGGGGGPMGMRPVYPRTQYNTQYMGAAQPPRVHAGDIPHSTQSKGGATSESEDADDRSADPNDGGYITRIGYGPRSPELPPDYFQATGGDGSQHAMGRGGKGFSLPPCAPPPEGTPTTPTPRHIGRVKPQPNLSPYKKPSPPVSSGPVKARSPLPFTAKAPDVTQHTKTEQDMTKSLSTEELSAEMANLEGLMKDLNAITQQEFEC